MGGLRIASVITGVTAAALWGAAVIITGRALDVDLAGAGTLTVAGTVFAVAYLVRDRDKDALVRCMADYAERRATSLTGPQSAI